MATDAEEAGIAGSTKVADTPALDGSADGESVSKKSAKKAEKAALKEAKKNARVEQQLAAQNALNKMVNDMEKDVYGYLPTIDSSWSTSRKWTPIGSLDNSLLNQTVWIRARIQESRCKGSMGFLMLREQLGTVQAVIDATMPKDVIKWAAAVPLESIVDVYGNVVQPETEVTSTTQKVEIHVQKFFCVSKAAAELPFQLKDASRPDSELNNEGAISVGQEVRLDQRILDLRTPANHAIFRVQSEVCQLFREYLRSQNFIEIHTPKLIGGASEGGANVFTFNYFGKPACLAQSPQLYKQMAVSADLDRVFEIGPVFRAENSNTHRHLCEFVGLDMEMAFKESYVEVLQMLANLFKYMFKGIESRCAKEVAIIHGQHPARAFVCPEEVPILEFSQGINMLRQANCPDIPDDISAFDLSTEQEKLLGRLVFEKYDTDFYMLTRYPLKVRPFYTMPDPKDPTLSNSYDFFMRGEEIVSGAQRIHDPVMLTERAKACGIPVETIQSYIDSFCLGAFPHGGCGIGLERVVMLFLGLGNIRKVSMFPRDPKRLAP